MEALPVCQQVVPVVMLPERDLESSRPQLLLMEVGDERRGELVDIAFHHFMELVERETYSVVGEAVLRKIVGPNPLTPVSCSNL